MVIVVATAVLALVGGGLFAVLSNPSPPGTGVLVDRTNEPAPTFSLADLGMPTRTISLADFRGKRLVLNFWASWCYPCRTEMPLLESAWQSERGRVTFVGIDSNDTRVSAIDFMEKVHATYPALFDPSGQVATAYGLFGLPTTVFISATGKMLGRHIGQIDAVTLQAALRKAFGIAGASSASFVRPAAGSSAMGRVYHRPR
ncbi:MAG TPA: TlpA disulfide reductase family protein [Acidimicrobiales bacterium]|nr:TlpA disulfide reductase family protein [Acidimicrobiales bacterium]HVA07416.1 TlpA disulfide reductase family protein [Acidimicrobiales bacterium]